MKSNSHRPMLLSLAVMLVVGLAVGDVAGQGEGVTSNVDQAAPAPTKSLLDFIRAGGPVGYLIIALSFVGIALVIDGFLNFKVDKLLPPPVSQRAEELARRGGFSEMLSLCKASDSMLSRIISHALSQGKLGMEAVREGMQESGTREVTRLHQRVGYIGFIASIAPMLGLLGTVSGMISSFNVLGMAKGAARPDELAVGISEAMVTTCLGLIVAVPLMFFHNYFRDRVTRIGLEASGQCERLTRIMTATLQARGGARPDDAPTQKAS
jgi:biopolymer transport protein ExbB